MDEWMDGCEKRYDECNGIASRLELVERVTLETRKEEAQLRGVNFTISNVVQLQDGETDSQSNWGVLACFRWSWK